jgi:hypothetical protein|tara:strand:- start:125 stop:373 length:249 start_codon:yes stop_codon:yes gene_type:complete
MSFEGVSLEELKEAQWIGTVVENDMGSLIYSAVHLEIGYPQGISYCGRILGMGEVIHESDSIGHRCRRCEKAEARRYKELGA